MRDEYTIDEIKRGFVWDVDTQAFRCVVCGARFARGEVFPLDGRFYEAARAVELHMELAHSGYLRELIDSDSKYSGFTENQKRLLAMFAEGLGDKEIAKALDVSPSTVRHQKFMFREKAKQARRYLAVYERVFEVRPPNGSAIAPIHENARQVDERYVVTEEEKAHILRTAFLSLEPLKLREFSPKEKKKVVILAKIAGQFAKGREYSEPDVNEILREVHEDYATLRRYLIQYGFMKRTKDCAAYWLA